jgi:hypothetical protein
LDVARRVLMWTAMPQAIDRAALAEITGGRQILEGIRNIYNVGVILLGVTNPTAPPIKMIPAPPPITRTSPTLPSIR